MLSLHRCPFLRALGSVRGICRLVALIGRKVHRTRGMAWARRPAQSGPLTDVRGIAVTHSHARWDVLNALLTLSYKQAVRRTSKPAPTANRHAPFRKAGLATRILVSDSRPPARGPATKTLRRGNRGDELPMSLSPAFQARSNGYPRPSILLKGPDPMRLGRVRSGPVLKNSADFAAFLTIQGCNFRNFVCNHRVLRTDEFVQPWCGHFSNHLTRRTVDYGESCHSRKE
jgi:hypothetical protein